MQLLQITRQANARVARHGVNVYPLEAYGILLGTNDRPAVGPEVLAALPMGKTVRWYDPTGRFADVDRALLLATEVFAPAGLQPVGLYLTLYSMAADYVEAAVRAAPHPGAAPWLLVRPIDGGETILRASAYRYHRGEWRAQDLVVTQSRIDGPYRNPRRLATSWNRAWGVLDYGNDYVSELARLGLTRSTEGR